MRKFYGLMIILIFNFYPVQSQVKIGNNPTVIQSGSLLELESQTKGLRLPRIALTDVNKWTLDGSAISGMVIFNESTAVPKGIYYWDTDSTRWIIVNKINITADNGLTQTKGNIQLGGSLTMPTSITTSTTNTLSLKGLQSGDSSDSIVVINPTTGVLRMISSTATVRKVQIYTATSGQTTFTTPYNITSTDKVQVFRNGAEMDFTASIGSQSVTLDFSTYNDGVVSSCLAGDEIKICQWK
jgi:hypothetical protein